MNGCCLSHHLTIDTDTKITSNKSVSEANGLGNKRKGFTIVAVPSVSEANRLGNKREGFTSVLLSVSEANRLGNKRKGSARERSRLELGLGSGSTLAATI